MSSPSNASSRVSVPAPMRRDLHSPQPGSAGGGGGGGGSPRSSFDHAQPGPSSYSSYTPAQRRPSQSSSTTKHGNAIQHSPTAMSSSGHREEAERESGNTARGTAGMRLPRITTSNVDASSRMNMNGVGAERLYDGDKSSSSGPHSAPLRSNHHNNDERMINPPPLRSSSSPDPWTAHHHHSHPSSSLSSSRRSSPAGSPIDTGRPSAASPILGMPVPVPTPHRSSPNPNSNASNAPYQPASSPKPYIPPRISSQTSERTLHQQHSHSTLASTANSSTETGHTAGAGGAGGSGNGDATGLTRSGGSRREGSREPTFCGQCGQSVHGQFVRAMGKVYHLNCFRCKDCNKVVAQKFFPVEDAEGMYPLCERDYFARLDLICAKCDQALRSSYITACGNKYHVEHFTCSECDVLFGPSDSYYEHGGKVYCHFHYSTRFAVKCVGCETAILKQFVEMNRNGRDECWHPECYMISKFWNVRLASKNFNTPANSALSSAVSLLEMTSSASSQGPTTPSSTGLSPAGSLAPGLSPTSEADMTPEELKDKQEAMEMRVQQIWHVLSGYEESSAALIGDMLRAVNGRQLLEIILLAERFILHVETLFAVIDDLEAQFALAGAKGMSHAREAKQLCRKLVNLFSTMSQISPHPQGGGAPSTQELFTLITQLAHYLKILIRIALTGSIKLEREQGNATAMMNCLARLNLLAMDGGDPTVKRRGDHGETSAAWAVQSKPIGVTGPNAQGLQDGPGGSVTPNGADEEQLKRSIDALTKKPVGYIPSTKGIAYGYRSLASEVTGQTTLRGPQGEDYIPPEGCVSCKMTIEEDCVRLGMFNRWHSQCVVCLICGEKAILPAIKDDTSDEGGRKDEGSASSAVSRFARRPPPRVEIFVFEPVPPPDAPDTIYCTSHQTATCQHGFQSVSRLEQYAFLLHIALRRLYVHFRTHHELSSVRDHLIEDNGTMKDRTDLEVKRMKSVTLDRKLSSTARLPQRSTVVESPAGRMADANGTVVSARSSTIGPSLSVSSPADLPPPSATTDASEDVTVDVIRPAFARNNTSVLIINEANTPAAGGDESIDSLHAPSLAPEDDAITLGDIPLLADQTIRDRQRDGRPLLSGLNQLQSLIIKHFALLQLQKTGIAHLIELDEVLELLDTRKNQWWNKIFKGNAKKDQKKKGIFGVPIEILVDRTGSDSQQGASNAQLRVPEIIEDIISTMRQMDMAVEGIFRKNGNIRRLQQLSDALDKDVGAVNLSDENPVQLAALLKRFLREMPDPLLTFRLHKLFCGAASLQSIEERKRCLHLLVVLLPRYNRDTMEVLFVFLKWVASFSYRDEETGSRMDMSNLATVICPSILYAKGANAARDESFIAIQAVQELLDNQDEYYHVPDELQFVITEGIYTIFAKELDLPPKEIHRHCSKYMQARNVAHQRVPGSVSGQVRDRPSDSRLSVHRSEGNLAGGLGEPNGVGDRGAAGGGGTSPFRPTAAAQTQALPQQQPSGSNPSHSRPTSWMQSHPGSQQSLHQALNSPSNTPFRSGGPFQGSANGSRNSSRGSAPSSPGPDQQQERRSFQMDRERSRTPVQSSEGGGQHYPHNTHPQQHHGPHQQLHQQYR